MEQLAVHHHRHRFTSIQSPPHDRACNAIALLPSSPRVRLQSHAPRTPACVLCAVCCVLVDARSGLGPEWGNRPPTPEPALDPHRRARSRLSRLSFLSRVPAAAALCPLPSAHCPVPVLSHSCGILGATRAG
ncbi:uncharacterized protein K444DRAFT_719984 [Hyaloscypha bicolor E]|uniref:Uncharacterized protein n=1 Tax=Hyaloscypha bicolor E TaxID=1095630 RepID=A0A2J6TEY3_9HELO|nr:uncharacterized protein K444DRAFT_719984 [Hyaloscypha bicolor E]PMD61594.1 hypothetical protein K444DRAFT_719984 [Hyaloscypha bicolor E]